MRKYKGGVFCTVVSFTIRNRKILNTHSHRNGNILSFIIASGFKPGNLMSRYFKLGEPQAVCRSDT